MNILNWILSKKSATTKLSFIKEVELDKHGQFQTIYFTRKNGCFISNSLSHEKEIAEEFFNHLVELKGHYSQVTILKEVDV
jgi:hypothetical protein